MSAVADREILVWVPKSRSDLQARYNHLHREMLDQLERSVALENHWLIYILLGWEQLAACVISHYLVQIAKLQAPYRWPYGLLWLIQTVVALGTVQLIRGQPRMEESPLKSVVNRVWAIFLLLCCNVAILNVVAGLPVFTFLPVLATLSSFAFLVLASLLSRRLLIAALAMFVTGGLIAQFPAYGFLLYGGGWFVVLQTLGLIFFRRRDRWLTIYRH
jgi:hypothetical protein